MPTLEWLLLLLAIPLYDPYNDDEYGTNNSMCLLKVSLEMRLQWVPCVVWILKSNKHSSEIQSKNIMLCRNYTEVTRVYSLCINLLHGSNSLCGVLFAHRHWCWAPTTTITITSILHGTNILCVIHNFHVCIYHKVATTIFSGHITVHISSILWVDFLMWNLLQFLLGLSSISLTKFLTFP